MTAMAPRATHCKLLISPSLFCVPFLITTDLVPNLLSLPPPKIYKYYEGCYPGRGILFFSSSWLMARARGWSQKLFASPSSFRRKANRKTVFFLYQETMQALRKWIYIPLSYPSHLSSHAKAKSSSWNQSRRLSPEKGIREFSLLAS